jgi:hypothetical protein
MTIVSNPVWTVPGPVPTRLALEGTITILEPGASVNLIFTGLLGGPPLTLPAAFLVNHTFSVELFGDQAIANAAVSTLVITINGSASFTGNGVFESVTSNGAIPEPATMLLLGTGLAGIAMKLRKRRAEEK